MHYSSHIVRSLLVAIIIMFAQAANAQSFDEGYSDWRQLYERINAVENEDAEAESIEDAWEHLAHIAEHPFNINTITQEQLEQLPFLSADDINAIGYYVYRYNGMLTLQELQAIPELSAEKRQLLRYFLYCGDKEKGHGLSLGNILKYGKHDLYYGGRVPTYERRGDVLSIEKGGYRGFPLKHQFRYSLTYSDKFRIGLLGANDSGEEFFAGSNPQGFDFYSFYVQVKSQRLTDKLSLSNLVVGRYRAAFGLGLVVNNNFSLGKSTMVTSGGRISTGFRPHTGTTDANYFQGAAATVSSSKSQNGFQGKASVFASYRDINATRSGDTISTIITSGYHRTQNEVQKKNTATMATIGGNYQFDYKRFTAGITAAWFHLNRTLMPDKRQTFRARYPEGRDFFNAGVNYGYQGKKLTFKGETAFAPSGQASDSLIGMSVATVNSLTYRPRYGFSATLLHRYFSSSYTAIGGRSFAESSNLQDENALFASILWRASNALTFSYYTDFAYFSRPKYLVNFPSHMVENGLQVSWHKKEWTATLRARLKNREYNDSTKTALVWRNNMSLRFQCEYDANDGNRKPNEIRMLGLRAKLLMQYSHYDKADAKSNGVLAMISGGFQPLRKQKSLSIDISAGYFNTDDYYSAIYAYERGMTYSMGYSQFYGEGIRLSLLMRSNLTKQLSSALKLGTTKYFDRNTIGTGMDEVQSSSKTDIDFQIRWRF